MADFSAGGFKCDITAPWPCWITVTAANGAEIRLGHKELADLLYVLGRARHEAIRMLGEYGNEVY